MFKRLYNSSDKHAAECYSTVALSVTATDLRASVMVSAD